MVNNLIDILVQKDKDLLVFLNSLGSEQWDPFWLLITNQFSWVPLFIFIIFLTVKSYGWKRGGFIIFSMILLVAFSDQFVNLIKNTTERLRPINDPEINHLLRINLKTSTFSFISGHATTSTFFSIFTILLLRDKYKQIYFLLIFPFLFAYSRLYLAAHFPIDVVLGILTGVLLGNCYYFLYKKADKRFFR